MAIACIDTQNKAIGMAHAGWRGAVAGVQTGMLRAMQKSFGTDPKAVQLLFGPSALSCCYKVDEPFLEVVRQQHPMFVDKATVLASGQQYFDLPCLVKDMLLALGVQDEQIDQSHNCCTICDERFFSYRRQGVAAGRQLSIIGL